MLNFRFATGFFEAGSAGSDTPSTLWQEVLVQAQINAINFIDIISPLFNF